MAFNEDGSHLAAKVGSLQIALPTTVPNNAADGQDVALTDLFNETTSMVKLVGDLSFVADGGVELVTDDFMTDVECGTGTDWPIGGR